MKTILHILSFISPLLLLLFFLLMLIIAIALVYEAWDPPATEHLLPPKDVRDLGALRIAEEMQNFLTIREVSRIFELRP